jgi:ribonuclease P protein subunit POP4
MPLTPETLPRHELAGLQVEVVDAPNPDLVGIAGRVVRETTKMLVIETGAGSDASGAKMVPKRGTTFEFALTDEAAPDREAGGTASKLGSDTTGDEAGQSGPCEGVAYVTVDGARLLSRPARRTETGGAPIWR